MTSFGGRSHGGQGDATQTRGCPHGKYSKAQQVGKRTDGVMSIGHFGKKTKWKLHTPATRPDSQGASGEHWTPGTGRKPEAVSAQHFSSEQSQQLRRGAPEGRTRARVKVFSERKTKEWPRGGHLPTPPFGVPPSKMG